MPEHASQELIESVSKEKAQYWGVEILQEVCKPVMCAKGMYVMRRGSEAVLSGRFAASSHTSPRAALHILYCCTSLQGPICVMLAVAPDAWVCVFAAAHTHGGRIAGAFSIILPLSVIMILMLTIPSLVTITSTNLPVQTVWCLLSALHSVRGCSCRSVVTWQHQFVMHLCSHQYCLHGKGHASIGSGWAKSESTVMPVEMNHLGSP